MHHAGIVIDRHVVVFENGPARGGIEHGRDEITLARGHQPALLFETLGLGLAAAADRRTLIRRITHDLTGLLPTPEEVEAFTREIAPLVAGIGLAATVGCGFTAQLGAMRISEEVDALEVMAIPSLPFLVTTRMIAGLVAIVPLYVVGLLSSYFATRLTVTQFFGQSTGTYDHYFNQFLPPGDVLWSFGKVLVFAVLVIMIHCYHGYYASGGPAGVGIAVGHAVRTSIVAINVVDLFLSMAIWGTSTTVRLAG